VTLRPAPRILVPWNPAEAMKVAEAAKFARRNARTVRNWAACHDIGRKIDGEWVISRVALLMFLESDSAALAAYLSGDRTGEPVTAYFRRLNVAI